MPKSNLVFICEKCDSQFPKWLGRCTECNSWGTIKESLKRDAEKNTVIPLPKIATLNEIEAAQTQRISTGIKEFDRVLGGGIVPSSMILIGGEPGIGKSTIIGQVAHNIGEKVLYVSGEESPEQIKMRMQRIGLDSNKIYFFPETNLESVCQAIRKLQPALAIIDSIQTLFSDEIDSDPGNMNQIRASTVRLLEVAKKSKTAVFIIGHITKEGALAGPKTLEHLVDTVIYLEGDPYHMHRLLRAVKNRFGPTNEVGVFEMTEHGLEEIPNPSATFLEERNIGASGSVVHTSLEGSRIFLSEIQSLVTKTSFGYPQRKALGFDLNRLNLLCAVLQKRMNVPLYEYDVHINVTGGLKINEPAADLAVCLSILSGFQNFIIDPNTAVFGEVGLGGEVRSVSLPDARIKEAKNLGFKKIIMPHYQKIAPVQNELIMVKNVYEAWKKIENL